MKILISHYLILDGQIEDEEYEHEGENETEGQIDNQVTELLLSAVNSVVFNNTAEDVVEQQLQPSTSSTEQIEANSSRNSNSVPETSNPTNSNSVSTTSHNDDAKFTTDAADERRLKNVECKICMSEEVGVVFLPCGHLLSCVFCAPAISQCPLCRETIRGRVRTFLS
jgi:baculoviral IAP repeat-containing protein 2/3